jgi:putative glycosyltransferase (TIGR04348 family)
MKILIVTPAPPESRQGNRVTAVRWTRFLRELGHRVQIDTDYRGQQRDLLIALHARKSHAAIKRFGQDHPGAPIVLALTGTDVYSDIHTSAEARESLQLANLLVVLQPLAGEELPKGLRKSVRVIYQSVEPPAKRLPPRAGVFDVCVMGHLRPVKDPFRTALAARLLPDSSRIRVRHLGAALSADMEEAARKEELANPRYRWLGEKPRGQAMRLLGRSRLLSLTSLLEGGANAVGEAVTLSVPVLSSRIAGSIGLLGEDYPGFFPCEDTKALADLLLRAETDAEFYQTLQQHCERQRPLFEPAREREAWRQLLAELG